MASRRDPWLDNAKALLITAVVAGHVLAVLPGDHALRDHLYDAVYVVHMPAFILVSGYLSQRFRWSRRHLTSLVTTLVVPYVVFTLVLHGMYLAHVGENTEEPILLDPFWALWFLAALTLWRLASPVLRSSVIMVPLSVAVSLLSPTFDSTPELALTRALQFLPYFVIGLHARAEWLEQLKRPAARVLGVLALVAIWVVTADLDSWASTTWLFSNHSYDALGADTSTGILTRSFLLVCSLAGSLAVLSLTPTARGWWTGVGVQSMTVYLGHTVVVQALEYDGALDALPPGQATRAGLVVSLLVVAALAAPPVVRPLRWLTDPVGATKDLRAALRQGPRSAARPVEAPRPDREPARA
ncbi:acyltransferase family protein [Nocardioides zeae]|uniref:Acyltransferase family protein n=1 Tax=Nocardioides imazamoxiresistens TaxID=3231893 RepID=A0ABU3PS27_9ACTN|nr:acyltransferase family protein [Nocardioides zeae]MDT9592028.1 acyltransferase family protein [Nocardioides zeae]